MQRTSNGTSPTRARVRGRPASHTTKPKKRGKSEERQGQGYVHPTPPVPSYCNPASHAGSCVIRRECVHTSLRGCCRGCATLSELVGRIRRYKIPAKGEQIKKRGWSMRARASTSEHASPAGDRKTEETKKNAGTIRTFKFPHPYSIHPAPQRYNPTSVRDLVHIRRGCRCARFAMIMSWGGISKAPRRAAETGKNVGMRTRGQTDGSQRKETKSR
ncbi:hypothetical protein C8R45DRAFT_933043 [Mycena sanguinolenta]|nr:hypothetical protein C8R45DRAFT_933043 [Mycena sanguinolenta]